MLERSINLLRLLLPEGDQYKNSANSGRWVHRDSEWHWDGLPTLDCQTCDHAAAGQRTLSSQCWGTMENVLVEQISFLCNPWKKFLVSISLRWWPTWCHCQPRSSDYKASYWLLSGSAWLSGSSSVVYTFVLHEISRGNKINKNYYIVSDKKQCVCITCEKFYENF